MYIKSRNVLIDNELKPSTLYLDQGKIKEILPYESHADYDYGDYYIVPGFIDLHLHGLYGADALDETKDSLELIRQKLLDEGTTSFLATSTTLEKETLKGALKKLASEIESQIEGDGAKCLGIHLEGPFLNSEFAGAHKKQEILKPSIPIFEELQNASNGKIKRVTLAPEMDEDHALTAYLSDKKILVSMGHTGATAKATEMAIEAGARLITHMYNGMPQIHHREVGVAGMAMLSDKMVCEFIADGIHVSPHAVELVKKTKGVRNIILVTDSNKAKGLPVGDYVFNGRNIVLNELGEARIKETGSLAGSTAKMNDIVKNVIQNTTINQVEAFQMASLNPAKLIHVDDFKGQIKISYDADIAVLDDHYEVVHTYISGKLKEVMT